MFHSFSVRKILVHFGKKSRFQQPCSRWQDCSSVHQSLSWVTSDPFVLACFYILRDWNVYPCEICLSFTEGTLLQLQHSLPFHWIVYKVVIMYELIPKWLQTHLLPPPLEYCIRQTEPQLMNNCCWCCWIKWTYFQEVGKIINTDNAVFGINWEGSSANFSQGPLYTLSSSLGSSVTSIPPHACFVWNFSFQS